MPPIHRQEVQKLQQKASHNRNVKRKHISIGDLVLLYNNKIKGKPKNIESRWLLHHIVEELNNN